MKISTQQNIQAIIQFSTDLDNSICMTDRRNAVLYLSHKIGADSANKIAEIFGLADNYYKI